MGVKYNPGVITNGLVGYWDAANRKSYPGSGTVWNDLSGNGNNGTLTNGPTFSDANSGSLVFDGADDYINLPYTILSGTGEFTVNVWLKANTLNGGTVFGNYPAGNLQMLYGAGYIGMWLDNNSTYLDSPGSAFTTNPVLLTALRRSNNSTEVYLNCISKKIGSSSSTIGNVNNFRIGTNTIDSERYVGSVYTVQIYNRALSAAEISQNYNALRGRYGI